MYQNEIHSIRQKPYPYLFLRQAFSPLLQTERRYCKTIPISLLEAFLFERVQKAHPQDSLEVFYLEESERHTLKTLRTELDNTLNSFAVSPTVFYSHILEIFILKPCFIDRALDVVFTLKLCLFCL